MITRVLIFLVINFAALGIGGMFTGGGSSSAWYNGLNVAPWTPPGWVFGAAWTSIMICFAFYMAKAWTPGESNTGLLILFIIQWALNVGWNPVFFYYHLSTAGLMIISLLTILLVVLLIFKFGELAWYNLLLAPYIIWLFIATSLNAYIVFNN